jgi:hypothetical protein
MSETCKHELAELALGMGYGERPEGQGHIIHASGPVLLAKWRELTADRDTLRAALGGAVRVLRDAASSMATNPRDWSACSPDAWLYGLVCGWDGPALQELADKHGWSSKVVDKLGEAAAALITARRALGGGDD